MYKIKVKNNETNKIWWEYGFSKFIMKRINFLYNETYDYNYYQTYEVLEVRKINFTVKTFKKCLTNHCEMCYN